MPEIKGEGAMEKANGHKEEEGTQEGQRAKGTTSNTFNPHGFHPVEPTDSPTKRQTTVAGVEMDEEILQVAGLL